MECKYFITSRKELYHYGIPGMKWGVRRYRNTDGSLTAKGKERYNNTKTGMSKYAGMLPHGMKLPDEYKEDSLQEVLAVRNTSGGYDLTSPLSMDIRSERWNHEYANDPDSVYDKCGSKVNSRFGEESGTTQNCTKVAATGILAKMGYDYEAGRCMGGKAGAFDYWFNGAERTVCDNLSEAIDQKLSKTTNGSFGTVDLRNKNGGGHVFNWERNSKGEFRLAELQPGKGEYYSGNTVGECFDKYLTRAPWFSRDSTVRVYDMTHAAPNFAHMNEDSVVRITDDPSRESRILDKVTNKLYNQI